MYLETGTLRMSSYNAETITRNILPTYSICSDHQLTGFRSQNTRWSKEITSEHERRVNDAGKLLNKGRILGTYTPCSAPGWAKTVLVPMMGKTKRKALNCNVSFYIDDLCSITTLYLQYLVKHSAFNDTLHLPELQQSFCSESLGFCFGSFQANSRSET